MKQKTKKDKYTERPDMHPLHLFSAKLPQSFTYGQKKSHPKISKMVDRLLDFTMETTNHHQRNIAFAQTKILFGERKIEDFPDPEPEMLEALKMARKWLDGEIQDEALFTYKR